ATAAMLIPIIGIVAFAMKDVYEGLGGSQVVIVGVALSASLAMSLPISTPPNAIAYSKGFIRQKDMVVTGLFVGIVGFVLGYLWLIAAGKMGIL
ncbi:MAG: anion permease, partial [Paludibacteraceae bacterium]|nr:anion permease [Paludibacteraceae bacterium]